VVQCCPAVCMQCCVKASLTSLGEGYVSIGGVFDMGAMDMAATQVNLSVLCMLWLGDWCCSASGCVPGHVLQLFCCPVRVFLSANVISTLHTHFPMLHLPCHCPMFCMTPH
jgi:hypothetical protein